MDTAANKTRRRTPDTVKTALEDIQAHCMSSRDDWQRLMRMAEKQMDAAMMLYLARIRDKFAEIDRLAKDAAQGEYRETP